MRLGSGKANLGVFDRFIFATFGGNRSVTSCTQGPVRRKCPELNAADAEINHLYCPIWPFRSARPISAFSAFEIRNVAFYGGLGDRRLRLVIWSKSPTSVTLKYPHRVAIRIIANPEI